MGRARTLAASAAVAAILTSLVVPAGARVRSSASCATPVFVQALGPACPAEGGYEVLLGDGTTVFTHGHDPVPDEGRGDIDIDGKQPSCVTDPSNAFHIQLVYVYPSDQPNRYSANLGQIRRMGRLANGLVWSEAKRYGRTRLLRMACSGDEPTVKEFRLSVANDGQSFAQVVTELRNAGFVDPLAKYWIYYDGSPPGAPAGTGTFKQDSNLRATNQSNFGPGYAVTWGLSADQGGAGVMLHELGHTLGAVQSDSPNSSGAAHCNDGSDIMCYDDGGPTADFKNNVCTKTRFDCGNNDYFHPRPGSRNYLAGNWNLGSVWNRFIAGCSYRTGMLQPDPAQIVAGAQQGRVTLDAGPRVSIPKACRGRPFALSATRIPLPDEVHEPLGVIPEPLDPNLLRVYSGPAPADADVCFSKGSRLVRCVASGVAEQGTVPSNATHAQVFLAGGHDGLYVLSIE